MTSDRHNTTVRLSKEEREELEKKMREYGFTQLSPFIRYAIGQLRKR